MQQSYTATATGPIAGPVDAGSGNTYQIKSVKVSGPAADSVVALETSPDGTTWTTADAVTGPNWASAALHLRARFARANVVSLGTGSPPLAVVLTYMQ